jgi:hypothetical protein
MIIQQTVIEIRGFFIIFAGGLFAFGIATQHLLRACPVKHEECATNAADFPYNFFYAMSATYFFLVRHFLFFLLSCFILFEDGERESERLTWLVNAFVKGGRYDPVSSLFQTEDLGFHLMMFLFFFFTVIVMLNMLIGKTLSFLHLHALETTVTQKQKQKKCMPALYTHTIPPPVALSFFSHYSLFY